MITILYWCLFYCLWYLINLTNFTWKFFWIFHLKTGNSFSISNMNLKLHFVRYYYLLVYERDFVNHALNYFYIRLQFAEYSKCMKPRNKLRYHHLLLSNITFRISRSLVWKNYDFVLILFDYDVTIFLCTTLKYSMISNHSFF